MQNLFEVYPNLRPQEISYNESGLLIRGDLLTYSNPRLYFAKALMVFGNEETNTFQTMNNGTRIQVDTMIGESVKYGNNCTIGGAGFGYEYDKEADELVRMPHLSFVVIHNNVTIHNLVNIDRGVLFPTEIGQGTVIDSLTHIAHGVKIGRNCAIVSGAVIGGSAEIGDNTFIGMNASIKQKVKIGKGCTIGAGAVVLKDVPDGWTVIGNPAKRLEK